MNELEKALNKSVLGAAVEEPAEERPERERAERNDHRLRGERREHEKGERENQERADEHLEQPMLSVATGDLARDALSNSTPSTMAEKPPERTCATNMPRMMVEKPPERTCALSRKPRREPRHRARQTRACEERVEPRRPRQL